MDADKIVVLDKAGCGLFERATDLQATLSFVLKLCTCGVSLISRRIGPLGFRCDASLVG